MQRAYASTKLGSNIPERSGKWSTVSIESTEQNDTEVTAQKMLHYQAKISDTTVVR